MNSLRYYSLDKLIEHCAYGKIDMHEPIEVANQCGTMRTELSLLKHFIILSKSNNVSLIHILSKLRCKLKEILSSLLSNNAFVRHYVENIINEWRLEIEIEQLLDDGLARCNYSDGDLFDYSFLTSELKCAQKGGAKIEEIEKTLKEKQDKHEPMTEEYGSLVNKQLSDLFTECNSCNDRVKKQSNELSSKYNSIDPKHTMVLLDLSSKPKSVYLDYSNKFKESNEIFANFLSQANDLQIPDTINTMFLNYVLTINMLKKEMNYINNSLKQIVVYLDPRVNTVQGLMEGFNPKKKIVDEPMDGEGLQQDLMITESGDSNADNSDDPNSYESPAKTFSFF